MNIFFSLSIALLILIVLVLVYRLRQATLRIQAMEAQTKAKDDVFSLIGHNLRGPLAVTEGLELLVEDYIEEGELEEIRGTFRELDEYLTQLRVLVEKLIHYSHSQNTDEKLHIAPLEVSDVMEELISRFLPLLKTKDLHLKQDVDQGTVKADHISLTAALGAVLENAIRYSPPGSEITILGKKDTKGQYRLEILDNGIIGEKNGAYFTKTNVHIFYAR
jgi:K+-sensing histidine kinase KdpD